MLHCWSTRNVLCTFLYTGEQLTANPMQLDRRPKLANPPAQQCRHSWKPSPKTKTLNTEPLGLKGISR
jgi:hypothetical protein